MRHTHLLTILYADQQSINKVPKIWGQLNEKGNGSSPDPFLARLWRALRKKGLARETIETVGKPSAKTVRLIYLRAMLCHPRRHHFHNSYKLSKQWCIT